MKKPKRQLKKPLKVVLELIVIALLLVAGWKIGPALEQKVEGTGNLQSDEQHEQQVQGIPIEEESSTPSSAITDLLEESEKQLGNTATIPPAGPVETPTVTERFIKARGYCNSFAGYTAAIVANGGLETSPNSYYYENGLDVSIKIEDDDDVIIEAFKNGEIDFFFMTVNKMSLVCKELQDANKEVIIPYITDTSTGGDGIVANGDYNSISSLQNAKIGMARNSVSEAMLLWLFNIQSDIDVNTVINNFELYNSTQEAVDAFVRGEVSAVATWDLTSALRSEESHLLFSSKDAEYLIIDALVVDKTFAEQNPDVITTIIDGCITAVNDINNRVDVGETYDIIRESIPDFATYDNATMAELLNDSKQLGFEKNLEAFDIAPGIYQDFCTVWSQIGFDTNPEYVSSLFDNSYISNLSSKWANAESSVTEESIVATENVLDREALVSQTANLLFEANSGEFLQGYEEEDEAMLDEFVKIAKVLNRMVIKIEGNVSLTPGNTSTEFDYELSRMRAQHAKEYMVEHGIDEQRIIIVANGGDKPITTNETAEGRRANRNCIISFYQGETE